MFATFFIHIKIFKYDYLVFTDLIVLKVYKEYRMRDSNPQEYNTNSLEDYYASSYVLILYYIVGIPRFELKIREPKSLVLPLHHTPISNG